MENYYLEEQKIELAGNYDVIVAGGGIAGVSAALAAKRSGCKVLLVEKSVILGGLATLGFVAIYLPLCNGEGKKIIGGIAEELLGLAIKYGYNTLPPEWADGKGGTGVTTRYRTDFSPTEFVLALDELMEKEGIDLLFDTVCCKLIMEEKSCRGIIVENKSGRKGYTGKVFIDTTGDLELMARAGVPCAKGENWLTYWAYSTDLKMMKDAVEKQDVYSGIKLQWLGAIWNGDKAPAGSCTYTGTDAEEITKFILDGRRMLRQDLEGSKGRERAILALPGMPQLRNIRRLCGYYELTEKDVFTHFDDSIGCFGDWHNAGPVYEIPYRTLISPEMSNVITAGRSIASEGYAWIMTRVIPVCSLTGQAAGQAAALAVRKGCSLQELDVKDLQHELARGGVMIHF